MNEPDPQAFVTTRWTQVMTAAGRTEGARAALSDLCATYYGPVLSFLRRSGMGGDEPEDVAHAFFAGLLEADGLGGIDRGRGRFRSYLLGALKHFVMNRRRKAARERHGGSVEHVPLIPAEGMEAEGLVGEASDGLEALFDVEWALAVVEGALERMEREAEGAGTAVQFRALRPWLSLEREPCSQEEVARALGMNVGAVKVAIHRLRKRFREVVRAAIRETLPEGVSAEEELQHLIAALTAGAGRGGA